MKNHRHGQIALIDGLGALFLVALMYIGASAVGNEIDRAESYASTELEQEVLRSQIRDTIPQMNITSQSLDADTFEINGIRFDADPPGGSLFYTFFLSYDRGVKLFYITEKD